jgi:hypothetical protein
MKSAASQSLLDGIDNAIKDILSFSNISSQEQAYLAKFLVVYICGIYEEIIETLINEMVSHNSNTEISNFIENNLKRYFRNPDIGAIKGLLGSFNDDWKSIIDQIPPKYLSALNSIVSNKNALAHGGVINITLNEILTYYNDSKLVIEEIDKLLL